MNPIRITGLTSNAHSEARTARLRTFTRRLLAGVLVACAAQASAFDLNDAMLNSEQAYSATQTITSGKNGKNSLTTQVYREGQNLRMDISESGQNMSVLIRMGDETNYMLMHDMQMYQEVKTKRIKQYQNNTKMAFSNQQKVGQETVNGYNTTKYTADFEDEDGKVGSGEFWVTGDEIVVRAVMQHKRRRRVEETTMDLTNLKIADQPDELFEKPAGYKPLGFGGMFSEAMRQSRSEDSQSSQSEPAEAPAESMADDGADADTEEGRGKRARKALGRLFGRGDG